MARGNASTGYIFLLFRPGGKSGGKNPENPGTGYVFLVFRPGFCIFRQRPTSVSSFSMKLLVPIGPQYPFFPRFFSSSASSKPVLVNLSPQSSPRNPPEIPPKSGNPKFAKFVRNCPLASSVDLILISPNAWIRGRALEKPLRRRGIEVFYVSMLSDADTHVLWAHFLSGQLPIVEPPLALFCG